MVLAALAAEAGLIDRWVVTDREAIQDLLPRLATAAQRRDAATVLAAIDPALRPEEVLITRLDLAVDRTATPKNSPVKWHFHKRCPKDERLVSGLLPPPEPAPARKAVPRVVRLPLRSGVFLVSAQAASQFAVSRHAWVASGSGQRRWMSIAGSSSGEDWKTSQSSWTWTSSPQSGRRGRHWRN
ncbi:MAG: hypothetical protein EBR86_06050 [Planctomycetia bacterium]|nr:hypothetical protein [Planctomycetia bacterium]